MDDDCVPDFWFGFILYFLFKKLFITFMFFTTIKEKIACKT